MQTTNTSTPSILLISARSDIGGGPKYMLDYARSIAQFSHTFIAAPDDQPFGSEFKKIAEDFYRLPARKFSIVAYFGLLKFIRKNRIHTVHSHGRGAGVYSRLLKVCGVRVIHTFHGIHREPNFIGQIKFWLDRILDPLTDALVFASKTETTTASLAGFNTDKPSIVVLPLAPECNPDPSLEYHSPIRLGSISRYDYSKGIDLLFEQLSHFKKIHPSAEWTFELAGDGDLSLFTIPDNIRNQVKLLGAIKDPISFLKSIDIYLTSSRWESFNISVLEAISQGVPCLISDTSGHQYFIREKVAIGFELNDKKSFSEKLFSIINSPKPKSHFEWVRRNHSTMNTREIFKL